MRWWLCVLLALSLLLPSIFLHGARACADGDMIEFADGDMAQFDDDGFDEFEDEGDAEFEDDGDAEFEDGQPSPGQPVPMDMTLPQFVDAYNAACADDVRVQGPTDRNETVFGITYLAAGDEPGLYAQLAIDPSSGQVLIAGAKLDATEDDPDLSGFASVAAAVMVVVFPAMPGERRESLLAQVMATDGTTEADGQCVVSFVVYDDGERAILMYHGG